MPLEKHSHHTHEPASQNQNAQHPPACLASPVRPPLGSSTHFRINPPGPCSSQNATLSLAPNVDGAGLSASTELSPSDHSLPLRSITLQGCPLASCGAPSWTEQIPHLGAPGQKTAALMRVELLQRRNSVRRARPLWGTVWFFGVSLPLSALDRAFSPSQFAQCAPHVDCALGPQALERATRHPPWQAWQSGWVRWVQVTMLAAVTWTVQSEQVSWAPPAAHLGCRSHPGRYLAPALVRRTVKSTQAAGFSGWPPRFLSSLCPNPRLFAQVGRPTLGAAVLCCVSYTGAISMLWNSMLCGVQVSRENAL